MKDYKLRGFIAKIKLIDNKGFTYDYKFDAYDFIKEQALTIDNLRK